jgi:hypothetical protein
MVRLGHIRLVRSGMVTLEEGSVAIAEDAIRSQPLKHAVLCLRSVGHRTQSWLMRGPTSRPPL